MSIRISGFRGQIFPPPPKFNVKVAFDDLLINLFLLFLALLIIRFIADSSLNNLQWGARAYLLPFF